MNVMDLQIFEKLKNKQAIKVIALGSSNTQRFDVGMHWFDFVELGFKNVFGGSCGQFINSGVTNNTSGELLQRFDNQVAVYRPDLVIITVGANDCIHKVSKEEFAANLRTLHKQLTDIGSEIVLQTYYACDLVALKEVYPYLAEHMDEYMQTVHDVAGELDCPVVDHYARWNRLKERNFDEFLTMMRDSLHVNALGNMVMGLDTMRFFNNQLRYDQVDYCREGLAIQYKLDVLARNVMDFEGRVIK